MPTVVTNTIELFHERMTWNEFMDRVQNTPIHHPHPESVHIHPSYTWDEGVGWDGMLEITRTGDTARTQRIAELAAKIRDKAHEALDKAPDWSALPEGELWAADIGAAVAGDPEPYRVMAPKVPRKFLIYLQTSASCNVQAQQLTNRAAAVLAVAQVLMDLGHEVDLRALKCGYDDKRKRKFFTEISLSVSPVLVATLAHPGFFRRLLFRQIEWLAEHHGYDLGGRGYGYPIASRQFPEADVELPGLTGNGSWGEASAVDWAMETLTKLTAPEEAMS